MNALIPRQRPSLLMDADLNEELPSTPVTHKHNKNTKQPQPATFFNMHHHIKLNFRGYRAPIEPTELTIEAAKDQMLAPLMDLCCEDTEEGQEASMDCVFVCNTAGWMLCQVSSDRASSPTKDGQAFCD